MQRGSLVLRVLTGDGATAWGFASSDVGVWVFVILSVNLKLGGWRFSWEYEVFAASGAPLGSES